MPTDLLDAEIRDPDTGDVVPIDAIHTGPPPVRIPPRRPLGRRAPTLIPWEQASNRPDDFDLWEGASDAG